VKEDDRVPARHRHGPPALAEVVQVGDAFEVVRRVRGLCCHTTGNGRPAYRRSLKAIIEPRLIRLPERERRQFADGSNPATVADHRVIRVGGLTPRMPDDKSGRDKQARDEEDRQRMRAMTEELERWDETEPEVDDADLDEIEGEIRTIDFPATAVDVVEAVGSREVESTDGPYRVADLFPETRAETYDSPEEVRVRVARPTVAAAMKRIVEANQKLADDDRLGSQRRAYEKTLRALKAIDADDDDEGIEVVTDWIVEQIAEKGERPGSRAVRRRAAKFCRTNGYEIRNDEWLGV
jgi:hypothetical protein